MEFSITQKILVECLAHFQSVGREEIQFQYFQTLK